MTCVPDRDPSHRLLVPSRHREFAISGGGVLEGLWADRQRYWHIVMASLLPGSFIMFSQIIDFAERRGWKAAKGVLYKAYSNAL